MIGAPGVPIFRSARSPPPHGIVTGLKVRIGGPSSKPDMHVTCRYLKIAVTGLGARLALRSLCVVREERRLLRKTQALGAKRHAHACGQLGLALGFEPYDAT